MAEKIDFDLNVKNNQLDKAIDSATKKSLNLNGVLSTAVGVFAGNLLTKGFDLATDAVGSLIDITQRAIKEAANQEVAVNNLNSALSRAGNLTKETTNELQAYAGALQNVSTYGDDATLNSLALLQSLTKLKKEGLQEGVTAAADLASALGIDLESATNMVAKAANGNVMALNKMGLGITVAQTNAETFANTLEKLNEKFGGAASSKLNTYQGAVTSLGNAYGDLFEPIGDIVVKNAAVIATINTVKDIFTELSVELGSNKEKYIELVQDGILITITAVKVFAQVMDGLTVTSKLLVNSLAVIGATLNASMIGVFKIAYDVVLEFLKAIPLVGESFKGIINPLNELSTAFNKTLGSAVDDFKNSADDTIFTSLSRGADEFADKVISGAEAIKLANTELKNKTVVTEQEATYDELLGLQAQYNADKALLDEQAKQAIDALKIEGGLAEIEAIRAFEEEKSQVIYDQLVARNELILSEEQKRIANGKALIELQARNDKLMSDATLKSAKFTANEEKKVQEGRLAATAAFMNLGLALSREGSLASKVLANAGALMNTYQGANQVLADPTIPVVAKPAFIAATIATGLANVARINGVQFEQGGFVGGVNGGTVGADNRQATIRDGELILNADDQRSLLTMLKSGGMGGGEIIIQVDGREIARAVRDQKRAGFIL